METANYYHKALHLGCCSSPLLIASIMIHFWENPRNWLLASHHWLTYLKNVNVVCKCGKFLFESVKNLKRIAARFLFRSFTFSVLCQWYVKYNSYKYITACKYIWDWFIDNKLSVHFVDDKTKSIPFPYKRKNKKVDCLSI